MLNVLSLFSGIGAFEKALDNLNIPYNLLAYCEIDKYASKAYSAIHGVPESKNLHDVTKIDILDIDERVDLITYGFPCQDISNAGKQKGFTDEDGNRTRSGLFFEALRIIDDYKPKFAIAENVKALTSKKFKEEFKTVLESLDEVGYNNYWQVLNAKDYGIPQNRERVFIISIRKDIDKGYTFPEAIPLTLRLKDVLESEVDEKYYLSDHTIDVFNAHRDRHKAKGNGFGWKPTEGDGVAHSLKTDANNRPDSNYIQVKEATKKGYAEAYPGDSVNHEHPNSKTRRGRVGKQVAQTLTTMCNQGVIIYDDYNNRVKADQSCIGTLTTNIGNNAKGNGTKIIEMSNTDEIDDFLNEV